MRPTTRSPICSSGSGKSSRTTSMLSQVGPGEHARMHRVRHDRALRSGSSRDRTAGRCTSRTGRRRGNTTSGLRVARGRRPWRPRCRDGPAMKRPGSAMTRTRRGRRLQRLPDRAAELADRRHFAAIRNRKAAADVEHVEFGEPARVRAVDDFGAGADGLDVFRRVGHLRADVERQAPARARRGCARVRAAAARRPARNRTCATGRPPRTDCGTTRAAAARRGADAARTCGFRRGCRPRTCGCRSAVPRGCRHPT